MTLDDKMTRLVAAMICGDNYKTMTNEEIVGEAFDLAMQIDKWCDDDAAVRREIYMKRKKQ